MADNNAPTVQDYNATGFADSSGTQTLQNQASQIKVDDASLRQQAVAQYQPTYEAEQRSLKNQLSALITTQANDSELLNKQYVQSINTMMSKLAKRGLNTGSTPGATTAALKAFQNDVMAQRQTLYQTQKQGIQNRANTLAGNYGLNIQARMAQNRNTSMASLTDFLTLIAKLQTSSFDDYAKYLTTKKDLANRQAGVDTELLKLEGQRMRLEGDRMGLENQRLSLEGDRMKIENQRLSLEGARLGLEGQRTQLTNDKLGLEGMQTKVETAQLGLEGDKLQLQQDLAQLEGANTKLQTAQAGLEADQTQLEISKLNTEGAKLDLKGTKQEIANKLKQNEKSSKSSSGKKSSKKTTTAAKTTTTNTNKNSLGVGYFAGSGNTGKTPNKPTTTTTAKKVLTTGGTGKLAKQNAQK